MPDNFPHNCSTLKKFQEYSINLIQVFSPVEFKLPSSENYPFVEQPVGSFGIKRKKIWCQYYYCIYLFFCKCPKPLTYDWG